jgi:chemotaxis protein CheZ
MRDSVDPSVPSAIDASIRLELQRVIQEMPDAIERLTYVGRKTEAAATDVLNLVDQAKAQVTEGAARGEEMAQALERLLASPDMDLARAMMTMCARQMRQSADSAVAQDELLTRIMLAQDFQDLTGQVIRKVCNVLEAAEQHLLHVQASSPVMAEGTAAVPLLADDLVGVQVPEKALQQSDVDDLLAELGF